MPEIVAGLTTGACATRLNNLVGMQVFDSDFILGQIDDGLLIARVDQRGGFRRRRYVRVHPDDLRAYISAHHAALLSAYDSAFCSTTNNSGVNAQTD